MVCVMGNVREDLFKLLVVVAAELDIPPIEYAFVPMIIDDSKLILKPKGIILINEKFKDNFLEAAKCLVHEMRHAYQIYYVATKTDKLSEIWKKELQDARNSENINGYFVQQIELDAFAFTQHYLRQLDYEFKYKNTTLQKLVEKYISEHFI